MAVEGSDASDKSSDVGGSGDRDTGAGAGGAKGADQGSVDSFDKEISKNDDDGSEGESRDNGNAKDTADAGQADGAAATESLNATTAAVDDPEVDETEVDTPEPEPEPSAAAPAGVDLPGSAAGAAHGIQQAGRATLVDNPTLEKRWESTTSPYTGKSGFTANASDFLSSRGITVDPSANPVPTGAIDRSAGVPVQSANNTNGALARDAIADRYAAHPSAVVSTEVVQDTRTPLQQTSAAVTDIAQGRSYNPERGTRRVDVVVEIPADDPRYSQRIDIESKVGRVSLTTTGTASVQAQAIKDADALAQNRALRAAGETLEVVGRVARPVGMAVDAIEVGQAIYRDGGIGVETGRTVTGLATGAVGGWGGAATGAAIGTAIMPGVGTVVGGIIGGIGGAVMAENLGQRLFDSVRSWWS